MSSSFHPAPARPRALTATLLLVVLAALVLSGSLVSPTPAQRSDLEPTARAKAEEVGLFAASAPRKVTKVRNRRPTEVGLQFVAATAGNVSGVEVYKVARAPGATPRRASLWNARGKRLATVKVTPRDGKGWVTVRFASPVKVRAKRTYTVSVFAPKGRYAMTERGLRKARVRGDLRTGKKRVGVRRHGAKSGFPTKTWRKSNYWVDVVFVPASNATDPTDPTVPPDPTNTAWPNADNTGVPTGTALTPYTGPMTIQTPGTVIDAKQINGFLDILAPDVTVSRSSIVGNVRISEDAQPDHHRHRHRRRRRGGHRAGGPQLHSHPRARGGRQPVDVVRVELHDPRLLRARPDDRRDRCAPRVGHPDGAEHDAHPQHDHLRRTGRPAGRGLLGRPDRLRRLRRRARQPDPEQPLPPLDRRDVCLRRGLRRQALLRRHGEHPVHRQRVHARHRDRELRHTGGPSPTTTRTLRATCGRATSGRTGPPSLPDRRDRRPRRPSKFGTCEPARAPTMGSCSRGCWSYRAVARRPTCSTCGRHSARSASRTPSSRSTAPWSRLSGVTWQPWSTSA